VKTRRVLASGLASWFGVASLLVSAVVSAQTVVSCPPNGSGGDQVSRGFYVQSYGGSSLGTVQLTYYTDGTAGAYTVSMTARSGAYDGPLIGTQTITVNLTANTGTLVTFDFGGAPVVPGSTSHSHRWWTPFRPAASCSTTRGRATTPAAIAPGSSRRKIRRRPSPPSAAEAWV
jgi:hypothetical protein